MTREDIMKRCEEVDYIWQAMKAGKKFKHLPTGNTGFIDEIDFHTDNGVVHFQSYGWFDADEVKPITPVLRIKQPVELMQTLVDGGFKCNNKGWWWKSGFYPMLPEMWSFCGQPVPDNDKFEWEDIYTELVYEKTKPR